MKGEIILPIDDGRYKFVQLYIDKVLFLKIGDLTYYHYELLTEIIKGCKAEPPIKISFVYDIPAVVGHRYNVVGMGYVTKRGNAFHFTRGSYHYPEMGVDIEHLEKCKALIPEGTIFSC